MRTRRQPLTQAACLGERVRPVALQGLGVNHRMAGQTEADCKAMPTCIDQGNSMSRIVFLEERCKGCGLCAAVCPAHIIRPSGRFNRQGYEVMETEGRCTGCASCALMCPDVAIRVFKSKKTEKTA